MQPSPPRDDATSASLQTRVRSAYEIAHCVHAQRAARDDTWSGRGDPITAGAATFSDPVISDRDVWRAAQAGRPPR